MKKKIQTITILLSLFVMMILNINTVNAETKRAELPAIIYSEMVSSSMELKVNNMNIKIYNIEMPYLIDNKTLRVYEDKNNIYILKYSTNTEI